MNATIHWLEGWFVQRPEWLKDRARRIIETGELNDADIQEPVMLCNAEADVLKTPLQPKAIPKGSLQAGATQEAVRLNSISEIKGINALSPRKPLEFGDVPLTIVYGPNGSGKSGYVRVLKHACGAKNVGSLHSNVFSGPTLQSCKFDLTVNGKDVQVVWSPSVGVHTTMEAIEIYDNQCAHVYVGAENEATYEPWALSLFSRLTEACTRVEFATRPQADTQQQKGTADHALEGNILPRFVLLEGIPLFGSLRLLGRTFTLRLGTVAVPRRGEHLHVAGNDVIRFPFVAVPVLPFASANGPFDVHLLALGEILATDFGQFPKGYDGVPLGPLLSVAGPVLEGLVRSQREPTDCRTRSRIFQLRILAQKSQ